jgi:benzoate/toluate 1,2-dioxygenase beta subunit
MIANVLVLAQDDADQAALQLAHHQRPLQPHRHFFGTSFYTLDVTGASPLIKEKKVVLKTDYIRHVIDVYHV